MEVPSQRRGVGPFTLAAGESVAQASIDSEISAADGLPTNLGAKWHRDLLRKLVSINWTWARAEYLLELGLLFNLRNSNVISAGVAELSISFSLQAPRLDVKGKKLVLATRPCCGRS